jgi:hypothetical protein
MCPCYCFFDGRMLAIINIYVVTFVSSISTLTRPKGRVGLDLTPWETLRSALFESGSSQSHMSFVYFHFVPFDDAPPYIIQLQLK